MHVVLFQPEIPHNTGNIARTCAVTGTTLHLIRPLGFSTDDKYLKRAGLDYWHLVDIRFWDSLNELQAVYLGKKYYYLTTRGGNLYTSVNYKPDDFLVFGSETKGLPSQVLAAGKGKNLRIPMKPGIRSLNLSNSVALVLYEALRQQGFSGLE